MGGAPTITDLIGFSWAKTRGILFPFNFKRWFKILIVATFALVGVGGCNLSWKAPAEQLQTSKFFQYQKKLLPPKISQKFSKELLNPQLAKLKAAEHADFWAMAKTGGNQTTANPAMKGPLAVVPGPDTPSTSPVKEYVQTQEQKQLAARIADLKKRAPESRSQRSAIPPAFLVWILGAGIPFVLGVIIFFAWVSARFNFVLMEVLVTGKVAIREPFSRYKDQGGAYFRWSLGFLAVILGFALVLFFLGFLMAPVVKGNPFFAIPLAVMLIILAGASILAAAIIGVLVHDFALPVVYKEKNTVMVACRKILFALKDRWMECAKYLFFMLAFLTLAMIVQTLVSILAAIGGVIAGGIVAIPGIIMIKALPFLKLPMIVLGGLAAIALILGVIVVIGMAMLPAVIFFRVFALAYLTRLYPECDLLGFSRRGS